MVLDLNDCLETLAESYIMWRNGELSDESLASDYDTVAYAYYERGEYVSARSYYSKAIELDRKNGVRI